MSSPCDSTIVMEKVLPTCCCSAPGSSRSLPGPASVFVVAQVCFAALRFAASAAAGSAAAELYSPADALVSLALRPRVAGALLLQLG